MRGMGRASLAARTEGWGCNRAGHNARCSRHVSTGRRPRRALLVACFAALTAAATFQGSRLCWSVQPSSGRRGVLAAAAAAIAALADQNAVDAFPNAVKTFKRDMNDPKRPGAQPGDLGLEPRYGLADLALKGCEKAPNCLSTTFSELDIGFHDVKPWKFKGKSGVDAIKDIEEAINMYEPGQQGIDGGGFQVKASGDNFVYVQFESLRRGHIDDVEFFVTPGTSPDAKEGDILVRSASRLGFYDFGVNAIRLNRIADDLTKKSGWTVERITKKSNPIYWGYNCDGGKGSKAPFSVVDKFPQYCL